MHQPGLMVNDVYDLKLNSLEIKVYPNPVEDILSLELIQSGNLQFRYELSDIAGRIIEIRNIQSSREEINLDNYRRGIYLLRILTTDNQAVKHYKILKR
ncbi:MAG: T9SS type A sorting domain-containing protein [Bacteroidales bacterium]